MASSNIISVARALRAPIEDSKLIIPAFCTLQLRDSDPVTVLNFITGAFDHQDKVSDPDSKVFPATVVDVKRIKREANGKPLGEKAVVILETTDKGGKTQEEEIHTGWVKFLGSEDPDNLKDPSLSWEIAHSLSVEEDALELVGHKVFVRKAFVEAATAKGGNRVRLLAHIEADGRENSSGAKSGSKSRSSARGGVSGKLSVSSIEDICEKLKVEYDTDLDDLTDVASWEGKAADVALDVAEAARIPKKDEEDFVEFFVGQRGTPQERAVLSLIEWR